jgi:hypothetical protein
MAEQLKPGDNIGLYIDDKLIHTGVLKDQGVMQSGRKVYQILLVKNIFQRNFPEIHFDADIRPVTWKQVQEEIKRLKIQLQKSIEKMEGDPVQELITEKELHNIIG